MAAKKRFASYVRVSTDKQEDKGQSLPVQKEAKKKGRVAADLLEENVLNDLFTTLGDPQQLVESMQAAIPNPKESEALQADLNEVEDKLKKVKASKERFLDMIEDGTLSRDLVGERSAKLTEQLQLLKESKAKIAHQLKNTPTGERIKEIANGMALVRHQQAWDYRNWKWPKRRELMQVLFGGTTADDKPLGVYIDYLGPGEFKYRVYGCLAGPAAGILATPGSPMAVEDLNELWDYSAGSEGLEVTECARR